MNWQTPQELPDLRRVGIIALDIETNDDGLRAGRGSAWPWRGGYICGISVAYRADGDIRAHYIPLRHPDTDNFDRTQVFGWLKDLIASDVRIVTQNGGYDWGWLRAEADIEMPSSDRLEEIGALATLIDENQFSYSLDALCKRYGLPGKDEALLRQAVEAAGFPLRSAPKEHIWQLPARYVGPYAEADAMSTLALYEKLKPILDQEGTRDAYRLEVDLMPMVLEMRRRGIRIDQSAAEQARDLLLQKRDAALDRAFGTAWHARQHGRDQRAANGRRRPSTSTASAIRAPLKATHHSQAGKSGWMVNTRALAAAADRHGEQISMPPATKFLEGHILEHIVNGRIHAEIHPYRSEDGGTRSLRFSYSNPPLQQMPSRDKEMGPLIRGVFLPEEGESLG